MWCKQLDNKGKSKSQGHPHITDQTVQYVREVFHCSPWKSTHSWNHNWLCLKQQSGMFFRGIHTCEGLKVAADVNVKTEHETQAVQALQCVEK